MKYFSYEELRHIKDQVITEHENWNWKYRWEEKQFPAAEVPAVSDGGITVILVGKHVPDLLSKLSESLVYNQRAHCSESQADEICTVARSHVFRFPSYDSEMRSNMKKLNADSAL